MAQTQNITAKTRIDVRKGDTVQVIAGKDRGKTGKVITALPGASRVLVEGVNAIRKHTKVATTQRGAQSGGIVTQEAPIHISNVMVVCPNCNKPARIGHRRDENNRGVRVCRRCASDI
ncbi:MAG: 50S ribosomal protein L24 [Actinomycetota bacterium]|nr:50S ribosomal protein L24 [Actinomycetota bacterium]